MLAGTATQVMGQNYQAATRILSPGGTVDTAGFDGGVFLADLTANGSGNAMTLQPDGKILIAGSTATNFLVSRVNADGTPDTDFGTGGNATVDFGNDDAGEAIAQAGRQDRRRGLYLDRFRRDGDRRHGGRPAAPLTARPTRPSEATDGPSSTSTSSDSRPGRGRPAERQDRGRRRLRRQRTTSRPAVSRLQPSGIPRHHLRQWRKARRSPWAPIARANAVAIQSDGKIVLAGGTYGSGPRQREHVRRTPSGRPSRLGGPASGAGRGAQRRRRCAPQEGHHRRHERQGQASPGPGAPT